MDQHCGWLKNKPQMHMQVLSNSVVRLLAAVHIVLALPYCADWKQPDSDVDTPAVYRIT